MKDSTVRKHELVAALQAACVIAYGRACFKTANGVPMGMPKKAERVVRDVLLRLRNNSGERL